MPAITATLQPDPHPPPLDGLGLTTDPCYFQNDDDSTPSNRRDTAANGATHA